jgi:hypothetical protein
MLPGADVAVRSLGCTSISAVQCPVLGVVAWFVTHGRPPATQRVRRSDRVDWVRRCRRSGIGSRCWCACLQTGVRLRRMRGKRAASDGLGCVGSGRNVVHCDHVGDIECHLMHTVSLASATSVSVEGAATTTWFSLSARCMAMIRPIPTGPKVGSQIVGVGGGQQPSACGPVWRTQWVA